MLPHQNCILQSGSRYFWAVSICYKSEQIITFVEVEKTEKFANGKVVSVNYAIKRFQNGMFIVSYSRSVLMAKIKENVARIVDTYKGVLTEKEMNEVLKKEMSYLP
jgi:hypothetical protein